MGIIDPNNAESYKFCVSWKDLENPILVKVIYILISILIKFFFFFLVNKSLYYFGYWFQISFDYIDRINTEKILFLSIIK
jgi:hypothetical protein